jgi:hypothetical protein
MFTAEAWTAPDTDELVHARPRTWTTVRIAASRSGDHWCGCNSSSDLPPMHMSILRSVVAARAGFDGCIVPVNALKILSQQPLSIRVAL